WLGHQGRNVLRPHTATVLDTYCLGHDLAPKLCQQRAQITMYLLRLLRGRRHTGANRPQRLGSQYDLGHRLTLTGREAPPALLFEYRKGSPRLALRQRFTNTDNGTQPCLQSRGHLFTHRLIRLAEILPTFRMAYNDIRTTHVHQHGGRDLAGVGAKILPEEIL